jgi:DNA-binding CsgD family transcriptional regulator
VLLARPRDQRAERMRLMKTVEGVLDDLAYTEIAQRLVIATGTVKSHVKQVLRILRVENRAEAISQYLRLTIGARED